MLSRFLVGGLRIWFLLAGTAWPSLLHSNCINVSGQSSATRCFYFKLFWCFPRMPVQASAIFFTHFRFKNCHAISLRKRIGVPLQTYPYIRGKPLPPRSGPYFGVLRRFWRSFFQGWIFIEFRCFLQPKVEPKLNQQRYFSSFQGYASRDFRLWFIFVVFWHVCDLHES